MCYVRAKHRNVRLVVLERVAQRMCRTSERTLLQRPILRGHCDGVHLYAPAKVRMSTDNYSSLNVRLFRYTLSCFDYSCLVTLSCMRALSLYRTFGPSI